MEKNNHIAIYLDMDGCLSNFHKGAKELYDYFHIIDKQYLNKEKTDEYYKHQKQLVLKIVESEDFWEKLEWMPNGKEYWKFIHSNFSNISILTAPIEEDKTCKSQKWKWVQKHLKIIPKDRFFCDGLKWNYVNKVEGKHQILIDDKTTNIEKWNQHGGLGIIHNDKDYMNTIEALKAIIKQ
jgi:hypothetical protein